MQTEKLDRARKSLYLCIVIVHLMSHLTKKRKIMKKVMFIIAATLISVLQASAQNAKPTDKDLIGVWCMESMQWDGEKKIMCGKENGYSSFKYYGADGEYACCEITLNKNGVVTLLPHEYGKYSFKNGVYSEMGRPSTPDGLVMTSKTTFKGRWKTRTELWKKVNLPEKVVRHIVNSCKVKETPADIQQSIKQNLFK